MLSPSLNDAKRVDKTAAPATLWRSVFLKVICDYYY